MTHVIRASNMTKVFGKSTAVDHISFDVREGEIFGFLDPSGAGKTTTTRMLRTASAHSHRLRDRLLPCLGLQ